MVCQLLQALVEDSFVRVDDVWSALGTYLFILFIM